MLPYEIMLSESQERMLIILKSGKEKNAKKIFDKWNLDFSIIGKTTNTKKLILNFNNKQVANLPLNSLSSNVPIYDRKWKKGISSNKQKKPDKASYPKISEAFKKILESPNNSEKSWVWEQYDHTVMGDTIQKPGGDAAVVRIHEKNKGVAITIDSSANYCFADPINGGKQIVSEAWRNLVSVGANPLAITNCLNFGNPEKEKVMGQFVECVDGISQACKYLDFPVVSGNVSFYNETKRKSIMPTPTIGGVGLVENLNNMMTKNFKGIDNFIFVVGKTLGHLYQSEFYRVVLNNEKGPAPNVNLFNEKNNGLSIRNLILKKLLLSVHDISSGGLLLALGEMCISGKIGAKINLPKSIINPHEYLFGEDQSRYLIEVNRKNKKEVSKILEENSIYYELLGKTQPKNLELDNEFTLNVADLAELNSLWYKNYFKES
jgi:phosphoribosylformylglycinamidine synthase